MIIIKKRQYTLDQAHYLLRHNGWVDDVTAFLNSLEGENRYCDIRFFKRHFREWKRANQEAKCQISEEQRKQEWDQAMQNPRVRNAFESFKQAVLAESCPAFQSASIMNTLGPLKQAMQEQKKGFKTRK